MEYREFFDVRNFKFWAGARAWFQEFARREMLDELQTNVESAFDGTVPTATQVNDYVWFDESLHRLVEGRDDGQGEDEENDDDDL